MQRWSPDALLVEAVRSGRCTHIYATLSAPDRCWVVAGLSLQGLTAEAIGELLRCSLRTVRAVKADPMTLVCEHYMREASAFEAELRLMRSEHTRLSVTLQEERQQNRRTRGQLNRMINARGGLCSNGHEMAGWNTYWERGSLRCRECLRLRVAQSRARRRAMVSACLDDIMPDAPSEEPPVV